MSSLKTLFLNPPSFDGFDGGAGSRYQAKREIRSFWYPTWLAQPAALVPDSRLIDAPAPGPSISRTSCRWRADYELAVLHTSTPSFPSDVRVAEALKEANPRLRIGIVGRPRRRRSRGRAARLARRSTSWPATSSTTRSRRWPRVGRSTRSTASASAPTAASHAQPGARHPRRHGPAALRHRRLPPRPRHRGLLHRLSPPPLRLSVYRAAAAGRGARSVSGPRRSAATATERAAPDNVAAGDPAGEGVLPAGQGVSSSTTTPSPTTCRAPPTSPGAWANIGVTWSCNAKANVPYDSLRVMQENGLRLLLVGYETGSQQILNNIRKGTRIDVARRFTEDCHKLGITIHGTFIVGLPGETHETIRETIRFAREINPAHHPGLARGPLPRHRAAPPGAPERLALERRPLVADDGVQVAALSYPRPLAPRDLRGPRAVLQTLLLPPERWSR